MEEENPEGPKRKKLEDLRGRLIDQLLEHPEEQLAAQLEELDPESGWEEKSSGRVGRNIIIGFGLCLIVALGIWALVVKFTPSQENFRTTARSLHFIESHTSEEVVAEVERVVRAYMMAETTEERARYVIGGEEVLEKMKEYEAREGVVLPQGFGQISSRLNSAVDGLPVVGVGAMDAAGKAWTIGLVPGIDGMFIDWESSVSYGEMAWSQFARERPKEGKQMRVYLLRFINEDHRLLEDPPLYYRISSPVSGEQIIAEPARGSQVEVDLKVLVPQGIKHPLLVKMRFHEGRPFAEITEVVRPSWLNVERAEAALNR